MIIRCHQLVFWALLLATALLSLLFGAGSLPWQEAASVLLGQGDDNARFLVMELRLPRLVMGAVVGLALGVAGALLQALTRNPLAEPGLLGVSGGSALAVSVAILLGASNATITTSVAQAGALAGCALVIVATRVQGTGQDPVRLVLAGATVSGLLLSLTSLLMLIDQRAADEIRFWITGSIAGRQWHQLLATLPSLSIAAVIVVLLVRPLSSLALGERTARSLGHRPGVIRFFVILAVALLVGGATALAGPLIFVGLVVPFVARAFVGADIRRTLWLCLPIGPALVIAADTLSRLLAAPSELPLGVITALVGAPALMMIVRARRMPTL